MALGRNERTDGRRTSSSYCSTTVVIFFVALGMVGIWMLTSSSVVPLPEFSQVGKPQEKQSATGTGSQKFEDNPGEPKDAANGKTNADMPQDENNPDSQYKEKVSEEISKSTDEKDQEEKSDKESEDKTVNSDNTSESNLVGDDQGGDSEMRDGDSSSDNGQTKSEQTEIENGSSKRKESDEVEGQVEEKVTENLDKQSETVGSKVDGKTNQEFPDGMQSDILNETSTQNGAFSILNETSTQNGAFSTQVIESKNENEKQLSSGKKNGYSWKVCNVTAGPDYIPCLDNLEVIRKLPTTKHYEHRERHCPEERPTCLVSLPEGYRQPIRWPQSREKIWYYNVPHTKLAVIKGHQNWVKVTGEYLTFPGGGTQFKHGAPHYIDFIEKILPDIAWGKRTRVVLDVGCGVASFGGYLFEKDVLTMSLAPKDEHEAQVQFALERGIPAVLGVMGTKRLPFPGRVFDIVHCARCRVPWHIEGGKLLLELNRLLRPGGYFVWSATPIYKKFEEDAGIWEAMTDLTKKMCWELVVIRKDTVNKIGAAIYKKPTSNECYVNRQKDEPPLCQESDDPNAAWNVLLQTCMHKVPEGTSERGSKLPESWPLRVEKPPYWLNDTQLGVYGKAAPKDFLADYEHWKHVVTKSYLKGIGISWSSVRNVMDMRSVYGGFAAALRDLKVWVMNVVPIDSPDTLPIIYERGLLGIYHDWCESFNTYPRTYDLLHADHLFSNLKKRCNLLAIIAEVDRILRPEGKLIVRDNSETIGEVEDIVKSLHWVVRLTYSKDKEGLLCLEKTLWRPKEEEQEVLLAAK